MQDFEKFLRNRVLTMRTLLLVYATTVTVLVFTVWWQAEQLQHLPPPAAEANPGSVVQGDEDAEQPQSLLFSDTVVNETYDEDVDLPQSTVQSSYGDQPVMGRNDPSAPPLALSRIETGTEILQIRFVWPVNPVEIITAYGRYMSPTLLDWRHHAGLDLAAPVGASVYATLEGRVLAINDDEGLGRVLILEHSNGFESRYGNLGQVRVDRGDQVQQGQLIAEVGQTSRYEAVEPPHLHWEIWREGVSVDPLTLIEQID